MGRGKLEIQNQDSHFPTAQNSLRRKEKRPFHKRLTRPSPRQNRALDTARPSNQSY